MELVQVIASLYLECKSVESVCLCVKHSNRILQIETSRNELGVLCEVSEHARKC